jgi:hypothetical protein
MCKPEQCRFCSEKESISHLFFECAVAKVMWGFTSEFLGWDIGLDYFSVASKWIHKVKFGYVNVISSAVVRAIWLMRNDMVFMKQDWRDVKDVIRRALKMSAEWKLLCREKNLEMMRKWCSFLEDRLKEPLKIQ